MKKLILTLLLLTCIMIGKSQTKLIESKVFDAKMILSNLEEHKSYTFKNFYVMTYLFSNGSGSAHQEGSDEVSHSILIMKTEYGEHEVRKFYLIKNLYNISIKYVKENEITININNSKTDKKFSF